VTFSPSGQFVLSGSDDKTARLWDVVTGREIWRFGGHSKKVYSVAFSGDGRSILTGSEDSTARLWDAASGREIRRFEGNVLQVLSVAFSPEGRLALTGNLDTTARLWDLDTGREIRRFEGAARIVSGSLIAGVDSVAFSADGRSVLMASGPEARLWDLSKGREVRRFRGHTGLITAVAFSPNGKFAATASVDKTARIWDLVSGNEIRRLEGHSDYVNSVAFSTDGQLVLTASDDRTVRLWDVASGREVKRFGGDLDYVKYATFSPDGLSILAGDKTARLWDRASGREIQRFEGHSDAIRSMAFSRDGRSILTGSWDQSARLWDVATGGEIRRFKEPAPIGSVAFSPDGRAVLVAEDKVAELWDVASGKELYLLDAGSDITSLAFSPSQPWVLIGTSSGTAQLWRAGSGTLLAGTLLATLSSFREGGWVVVAPDGRFDTSELDGTAPVHWMVDDQPFRALPLEIFMRDYYEPQLLPRFLSRERVPEVRQIQDLNRVQPDIKILGVQRGQRPDEARLRVEVSRAQGKFQRDGRDVDIRTDPYDLRVFRAGQLVGQDPEPKADVEEERQNRVTLKPQELQSWRQGHRVMLDAATGKAERTFVIRLPHGQTGKEIAFTAYAFNEDRVKSETASAAYMVPTDVGTVKKHAYVVTIGINGYQNPHRNLEFAVKDAQDMASALQQINDYNVVSVSLLSESWKESQPATLNQATKANIRAVLAVLAGSSDRAELNAVPNADQLAKATPDDLVILSFSGHGHTEPNGAFYLLPSDSGTEDAVSPAELKKFISSEEISEWLREVDAGQMAMIIDACHSAASVETPGFKPGPMGDRGLGQLAYDKGMRILAASQADNVALEIQNLHQGLLTYALVWEGLRPGDGGKLKADLNGDGVVTLEEWLKYGEQRTPSLYEDAKAGKVKMVSRDSTVNAAFIDQTTQRAQTPALFDFHKKNDDVQLIGP
jgi:WD40 repeat protein/uncharacterized caspase-like protein